MEVFRRINCKKKHKLVNFSSKNWFLLITNIFYIWNMVYSDRSKVVLSDETIRIPNFYHNQKLWCKTAENWRNCFVAEKSIVSKLSEISITNLSSTNQRTWMKIVSKFHVPNSYTSREISRQRAIRPVHSFKWFS